MEVSNLNDQKEPGGQQLIDTIVSLTGLPENLIQNELNEILAHTRQEASELTLDQLRASLLEYLEAVNESYSQVEEGSGLAPVGDTL